MDDTPGPALPPQVAEKVKALEDQIAAQPRAKALYLQLSQLHADNGHKAQAIATLERCLVVDPGNALVKHKLSLLTHAGVGTASDVTIAMELGCDGVLLNTGIASARDPLRMARAMRLAIESGYLAARAGRIPRKLYATASSPLEGTIR